MGILNFLRSTLQFVQNFKPISQLLCTLSSCSVLGMYIIYNQMILNFEVKVGVYGIAWAGGLGGGHAYGRNVCRCQINKIVQWSIFEGKSIFLQAVFIGREGTHRANLFAHNSEQNLPGRYGCLKDLLLQYRGFKGVFQRGATVTRRIKVNQIIPNPK